MTRIGRRLIEDFLLPALNDQRYGDLLRWVDRDRRHFSIRWSHKNAAKWTLADTAVFQDWDRLKGHYRPEIKGYYMQAKQRFRAALYKLNSVRKLPCEDKHVKKYQLIMDHDKRREFLARSKIRIRPKEENAKFIQTPVICKHVSPVEKPKPKYLEEPPMSPPSPASSTKSDMSDKEELEKCLFEYTLAQKKQMLSNGCQQNNLYLSDESPTKEYGDPHILRENAFLHRSPHVPIHPAPVYHSSVREVSIQEVYDVHQKRFESPHVLLVKTYHDLSDDDETKVKEEPVELSNGCIYSENTPDVVLNLSVKSEDSETASR